MIEIEETSYLFEQEEKTNRLYQVTMHLGKVMRAELLKDFDTILD